MKQTITQNVSHHKTCQTTQTTHHNYANHTHEMHHTSTAKTKHQANVDNTLHLEITNVPSFPGDCNVLLTHCVD